MSNDHARTCLTGLRDFYINEDVLGGDLDCSGNMLYIFLFLVAVIGLRVGNQLQDIIQQKSIFCVLLMFR